jgi:Type I restriction enzyme HindI endonuclease subunit-like, C-terminal
LRRDLPDIRSFHVDRILSEDEIALEANDSAVKILGDETLRSIARELVTTVRNNVTIDWTLRENVRKVRCSSAIVAVRTRRERHAAQPQSPLKH